MTLAPLRTLPLRASLRLEREQNARDLRRGPQQQASDTWLPPETLAGLRVRIDPYPDLGHQLSTWIAGYLWARDLGVPFFGGDVSKDTKGLLDLSVLTSEPPAGPTTERRLAATGFENETWSLPALQQSVTRASARSARPWTGRMALDQRRWDQTPIAEPLRRAVLAGYLGADLLQAEADAQYVAIHARRGDIGPMTHPDRWIDVAFYERLIAEIRTVPQFRIAPIRLYTSGDATDLRGLEQLGVVIKDTGGRARDFVEIAAARLVVAAPSSFGFLAALVSRSPVIARVPWWHHVPDTGRWLAYQASRGLDTGRLEQLAAGSPS
jgi:hypothetical protein